MKAFEDMEYHPLAETLVRIIKDKTQRDDSLFFRIVVAYYFALAASQMRCAIATPDGEEIPTNMYALNLAPSGYGKTMAVNFMEEQVLAQFRPEFLNVTFPTLAEDNLAKLAIQRANIKRVDPDKEIEKVQREFENIGPLLFSFDSGTSPAVKAMRHKLLMANAGSMNLIMDEVGANLSSNMEVFDVFIELYDKGLIKQKLVKHTAENKRSEEIIGKTPANLLMFGVPNALLDGAKKEEELMSMLDMGYARRCFFGYIKNGSSARRKRTAEEIYEARTNTDNDIEVGDIADRLGALANIVNANKRLTITKETYLKLIEYQLLCEERAEQYAEHQEIPKIEMQHRHFKVLKLAGAYAFIDDSMVVTEDHIYNAIKLAEDSGEAFHQLLNRDKPFVKLARYIASVGTEVTQADLAEDLPFYKGSVSHKNEMMQQAMAYGYKNNIIIKRSFEDGIEFLRGETLQETDMSKMIVAYSTDIATGYLNEHVPFSQLSKLVQMPDYHWVNHHLINGHRAEEDCMPGFNLVVVDVDGGVNMSTAKLLLKDYAFLLYTTKRHTDQEHRFRLILPISYHLKLDAKEYKQFMNHVFDWLPFEVDRATNQRARKWLTHPGIYEYNEGLMLDPLPFIPKTSKNEEHKNLINSQQSLDNLERWVINNIGDGNRNNMLLRYAMILVDAGYDFEGIRQKVMGLNDKVPDRLDETEIMTTIMVTVAKTIASRP